MPPTPDVSIARPRDHILKLAYVILLPDEVHNFMRRVQAELYERYEAQRSTLTLEPHITIKQPFEALEAGSHETFLARLTAETEPFEIVMRGFGFFEGEGVVFLDVEQDPRLLAIQRRVLGELALEPAMYESGAPVPYHFHGTLATGLSADDLEDARKRLGDTPEFRFPLQTFGLFRQTEETWTLYKRLTR
jgi:2'-5' RNA ligase